KQPLGLGHAVLCGLPIVGQEPFAVLLGDEIMHNEANEKTVTRQLADNYEQTGISTVAVMKVADQEVHKYGIVDVDSGPETRLKVKSVVEKPKLEKAPSRWALPGRYVFTNPIMNYLKETKPGMNGEIQLTDAMCRLAKEHGLNATTFKAERFDAGDK